MGSGHMSLRLNASPNRSPNHQLPQLFMSPSLSPSAEATGICKATENVGVMEQMVYKEMLRKQGFLPQKKEVQKGNLTAAFSSLTGQHRWDGARLPKVHCRRSVAKSCY